MKPVKIKTKADLEPRASKSEIARQYQAISKNETFRTLAHSNPHFMVVLNEQRQIICANKSFENSLSAKNRSYVGLRPGEALNCIHSDQNSGGCGTSENCKTCGAMNTIMEAINGKHGESECRIITKNNDALDFAVSSTPYHTEDHNLVLFYVQDISNEKRRRVLERVFFHDVLNSAGGVAGLSSALQDIKDPEQIKAIADMIQSSAKQLVLEITEQKQLMAAENGQLHIQKMEFDSVLLLEQVKNLYEKHELAEQKFICIDEGAESVILNSDPVLLKRIIGNMVKNALEASSVGQSVRLSVNLYNNLVLFSVHNYNYMDEEIQLQLFKRSFSTKGVGRGLGTYSMKLFGEKYLKGKVWFKSTQARGTTFFIELPLDIE